MKKTITLLCGIFLGVSLTFIIAVTAVFNVLSSPSYYLKQDDRYDITGMLELKNKDEYGKLASAMRKGFSGKKDFNTIIIKSDGTEIEAFTEHDAMLLENAGRTKIDFIVAGAILLIAAVAYVVVCIKKFGRKCFLTIGISSATTCLVLAAAVNIIEINADVAWGWQTFFFSWLSPAETMLERMILDTGFMKDFADGTLRFYDFLMIIPIAASYFIMGFSAPKKYDPNEDYMYQ